jgi:hypothetical protein
MRLRPGSIAACSFALAFALASFAGAEEQPQQQWGDLKGSFELVGQAPAPKALVVPAAGGCGAFNLVDESLVIGRRNGIANIVIYLQPANGAPAPAIHPQVAAAAAKQPAVLDNAGCRFDPHVAVMSIGQDLKIGNRDAVGHNVNAAFLNNQPFNILVPANGAIIQKLPLAERIPIPVTCNIHPWMQGYLMVAPTHYVAVTDERGKFEIENLPIGAWEFRIWHERAGYIDNVTIANDNVKWPKGLVQVQINAGKNDLGDVTIDRKEF